MINLTPILTSLCKLEISPGVEKNKTLNELQDIGGKNFSKNDPGFIKDGTIYLNPEYKGGAVKTSSHELLQTQPY